MDLGLVCTSKEKFVKVLSVLTDLPTLQGDLLAKIYECNFE